MVGSEFRINESGKSDYERIRTAAKNYSPASGYFPSGVQAIDRTK
jgi:hypothetical protein